MKRSHIYLCAIVLSAVFGFLYFSVFSFMGQGVSLQAAGKTPGQFTIYVNQLGIYENAEKMYQNVSALKAKGIDVLAYKKGNLTVFVTHVTKEEKVALEGIPALKELGFKAITKRYDISDQELIEELKKGEYEKVLSSVEASATIQHE